MAKRRVSSQTPMESDLLNNLAVLGEEEELDQFPGLGGAMEEPQPENVNIPKVPSNPDLYDQPQEDSGFPAGLEFLQDLMQGGGQQDQMPMEQMEQAPTEQPQMQEAPMPMQEAIPDEQEGMAEAMQEVPEEEPGFLSKFGNEFVELGNMFGDYFSPEKRSEVAESNARMFEDNKLRDEAQQQGLTLEEYKTKQADEYGQDQEKWTRDISESLENPYTKVVFGATDTVFNSEPLMKEVEKIGIPVSPEMKESISNMEAAISEQSEEQLKAQGVWNEQIQSARERIDQNKATDSDKWLIGLALLMPLVVGGFFGAEAGLSALQGGAEGLIDIYKQRQTDIKEDEDRITNINKLVSESKLKQGDLDLKRLAIPETVKKSFGEHPYEHLKNMDLVTFTDDEGNQTQGVRIKPGLVADISYLSDKDSKKDMMTEAKEVNENRTAINKLGDNARKIIEISQQIKDDGFFDKVFQSWAIDKKPSSVAKFGTDIMLDGRKVNSAVALTQILEDTLESRRNVMKIKNFGDQLFQHFERILTKPYGEFTSPQDLIDQSLRLYTDSRDQFMGDAERRGFIKEALLDDFYEKDQNMYQSLNKQESSKKEVGDKSRRMMEEVDIPNA